MRSSSNHKQPVNSCVIGSAPIRAFSSLSVRAPRQNTVLNTVRRLRASLKKGQGHDSDCDADEEDEGEEEEVRCFTGVKIRPGRESEGLMSTDSSSSSDDEDGNMARSPRRTSVVVGSKIPGEEGKKLMLWHHWAVCGWWACTLSPSPLRSA